MTVIPVSLHRLISASKPTKVYKPGLVFNLLKNSGTQQHNPQKNMMMAVGKTEPYDGWLAVGEQF